MSAMNEAEKDRIADEIAKEIGASMVKALEVLHANPDMDPDQRAVLMHKAMGCKLNLPKEPRNDVKE